MKKNILLTGGAGFIGANLAEALLADERVALLRVLDNLATGSLENLSGFRKHSKFEFIEGDIRELATCMEVCKEIDLVCHQAALGSVPRSINDPATTNAVNITGTLNVFIAAKENKVERVVYAASSSTYGDHPGLPKVEDKTGNPLSPYAVTKLVNELYADVFQRTYGLNTIGLRYFNVFGPKQNPNGPYAAVIPIFIEKALKGEAAIINGDGETSRDFTYISNAVHANVCALFTENEAALNQVYNVACGEQTTLNELFEIICQLSGKSLAPIYGEERAGDVKHSLADINKAKKWIGYDIQTSVKEGIAKSIEWYKEKGD